jgi:hypothetical protein
MKYALATIATIAGIIAMIITGTVTRLFLILQLIICDIGIMSAIAYFVVTRL